MPALHLLWKATIPINIAFSTKVSILYDVSLGLCFLHNCKPPIVHHDLTPNNIMLTSQLVAKIGDLGVARIMQTDNENSRHTKTAEGGTRHFMPPEALDEINPMYGTPVDVFSFGGIVLYVLTEEWPTPSNAVIRDPVTKKLVALDEVERRQQYVDKMTGKSVQLRKMVEQCLNNEPDMRPLIQELLATIIGPLQVRISTHLSYCF